jgi:hypothetical protein
MKKSNLKLVFVFLLAVGVGTAIFSCRKSVGPPDPNLSITVDRKIVVSALNAITKDSIGQFTVAVTTPSATLNQTTTGNTYVIKDPVAGSYVVVISKTGYVTSTKTFTVVLPTDAKASLLVDASVAVSKAATPVVVTAATGGTIAVATNSEVTSSAVVANATVAPGTVFTLADGSKPASVSISVTNIPVNTTTAPVVTVNGVPTSVVDNGIEVVNNSIPSQKIDLQPTGLVLDKPMVIDVYIGDKYPTSMSQTEKIARQAGLTLNYVRKDGTVEVVTPDHFSADRNTVYYKITHFSEWDQANSMVTMTKSKSLSLSPVQLQIGNCGVGLTAHFSYISDYTGVVAWLLTGGRSNSVRFISDDVQQYPGNAGFQVFASFQYLIETWDLSDLTPGFSSVNKIAIPGSGVSSVVNNTCHNQGGN